MSDLSLSREDLVINVPTWPAPGLLDSPKLWHRTCPSALDVTWGQSPVCTVVGRGPQVSWSREKQGVGSGGILPCPADGDYLQQIGSGPLGPQLGAGLHLPRKAGLGTGSLRPNMQRWAQGSIEGETSCSPPSQPGLHQGQECGGHHPVRVGTQT